MAELLLQHGADRSARSEDGTTAAEMAQKSGHDEIAKLLE